MQTKRWSGYQWTILLLMCGVMMLGFIDRVNMSVVVPVWIVKYHMSPAVAGFILSIVSWAYAIGLFFAGPVADRWHQKRVLPLGVAVWTAATWLMALTYSIPLFAFLRAALGLGESAIIPSNTRTISEIFSPEDRGRTMGVFYAGAELGLAVGTPLAALILFYLNWQAVFLVTGALSLVWLLIWLPIYRSDKAVIEEEGAAATASPPVRARLTSLLARRQTWALMIGHFGALYVLYVYITWLPSLLALEHHFSTLSAGWFSFLIFMVSIVTIILGGWLSDLWLRRGGDLSVVRKTFCFGGMFLSTVAIVIAAYAQGPATTIIMLMLSIAGFGFWVPSAGALAIDLAPRQTVASLAGLQTFLGNIGSALAPLLTGFLFAATHSFQTSLLTAGGIALVTAAVGYLLLLGKVEKSPDLAPSAPDEGILSAS